MTTPTYERFGVIHYSVANMPGAVPRTSTLSRWSPPRLPYLVSLGEQGRVPRAARRRALLKGLNTAKGCMT
jgi:alanine dehydrogenase